MMPWRKQSLDQNGRRSGKVNRVSDIMPNQKTETFDNMFLPVTGCEAFVALIKAKHRVSMRKSALVHSGNIV